MNAVVLCGHVRAEPVERVLDSGRVLVTFDLVTQTELPSDQRLTVPVVWATDHPRALRAGDQLVVVGSVGRRFFRAGATTVWRTDVVAAQVLELGSSRSLRRRLEEVRGAVLGLTRPGRVRSVARPRRVDDTT